uniref:Glycosyltransferase n=1 Tax=Siraitia grosvenorii TaxID=190515 RepID=K7NC03_SIRGR|nr:UDP-glucosyltransferase [Siraitia grosvenorii]
MVVSTSSGRPHFVLFPLMAQGHMIPMIDLARLIVQRGVIVTIFTSPQNAARFEKLLARAKQSGLQIHLLLLDFRVLEASGSPPGCENLDQLPSFHLAYFFLIWLARLQPQTEEIIQKLTPPPSCMIADLHLPWTAEVARKFDIPWIGLHTGSSFCQLNCEKTKEKPTDDFFKLVEETKRGAYGMVVNSFDGLEQAYVEEYKQIIGRKTWCVGPVSLCNTDDDDEAERGWQMGSASGVHQCLKWLDSQIPESVLYVCLGSLSNLPVSRMAELGLALEASKKPFLWLLRAGKHLEEVNKWISEEGYEERMEGRGVVVRGWAPQLLILSHPSVGGFLTHCGWNSVLEGISVGVPMVTLPLFADQFCNEKLVVDELKIGVKSGKGETDDIRKESVTEAIRELMDEGGERRKRARELCEMANKAMGDGGSSQRNLTLLIEEIEKRKSTNLIR